MKYFSKRLFKIYFSEISVVNVFFLECTPFFMFRWPAKIWYNVGKGTWRLERDELLLSCVQSDDDAGTTIKQVKTTLNYCPTYLYRHRHTIYNIYQTLTAERREYTIMNQNVKRSCCRRKPFLRVVPQLYNVFRFGRLHNRMDLDRAIR